MKLKKTYTIKEIADILNLPFAGNPDTIITGISDVYHAKHLDITFADNEKYFNLANLSSASVIITEKSLVSDTNKGIIYSDNPFKSYNKLVSFLLPNSLSTENIHPDSIIGSNTFIHPSCYIGENVIIGENCTIYPGVSIFGPCSIGNNVVIYSGAVVGCDAFYFKKENTKLLKLISVGKTEIGDFVEIGSNTTIERGLGGTTLIGKGTKIGNSVYIAHDSTIGEDCLICSNTTIGSNVIIEDEVTIREQVSIQKDLIIGKEAVILTNSAVIKSLDAGKIYFGIPADELKEKMKESAYLKQIPSLLKILNEKL